MSWGTDWTTITMDFFVQSKYEGGPSGISPYVYPEGQLVTPIAIIPWVMAIAWSNDSGVVWFANTSLYILP